MPDPRDGVPPGFSTLRGVHGESVGGRGHYHVNRDIAEDFQRGGEFDMNVFANKELTGAEKCLVVTRLSDEALIANARHATSLQGQLPSPFNPPRSPAEEFTLLMVEVFRRYQQLLREKKE